MLNLNPIFADAIVAIEQHSGLVRTPPLPSAIFMLQRDVINHYRYALTHYLCLSLNETFLQNSSIGSPYDKWAKFTNEDFKLLTFSVNGLLRYTSRLVHETTCRSLSDARRYHEMKNLSGVYTDPICEIRAGRAIGIQVHTDHALSVTAFGPRLAASRWDISDRSVVAKVRELCDGELAGLSESTQRFARLCQQFYSQKPVIADFDAMNESWWV